MQRMKVIASSIPAWFGAQALTVCPWLILVVPQRAADAALIAHEEVHARQQRATGWFAWWWWRYLTDEAFRLDAELEAYRVQLAMQPHRLEAFATALATIYRLDITPDEARALLTEQKEHE